MPNYSQIVNVAGEKVVTKASSKSFLRRFAEKIGLVQREVAECRGKSLSEMAEMTSKKDVVTLTDVRHQLEELKNKKNKIEELINSMPKSVEEAKLEIKRLKEAQEFPLRMYEAEISHVVRGPMTQEYSTVHRISEHNENCRNWANKFLSEKNDLQRRIDDLEDFINNRSITRLYELKKELSVIETKMFKLSHN